ncbi:MULTISPECIES: hypothetical protein [unclassified Streptomyces]|uniref:hypothetical protein n=1 Tax=unclassified Streptomyces TaxID=2593676 RepID=UPI00386F16C6
MRSAQARDEGSGESAGVVVGIVLGADAPRAAIGQALAAGFPHIVLGLPVPYPADVARWLTGEVISESV